MAAIQDIIYEVQFIKQKSDQLENAAKYDSERLQRTGEQIAAIVKGSNMGTEALQAVSVALRSISFAEASMRALSRVCDTYIEKLRQ